MAEERDTSGRFVAGHTHIPGGAWTPKIERTPENAEYICRRIIENARLWTIAQELGAAGHSTITMWVHQDKEFAEQYRQARMMQADTLAEEVLEISDDGRNDWMTVTGRGGKEYQIVDKEVVLRARLRVDTRLRLMAAFSPKRYGTKVEVEHDVSEGFAERLVRARERVAALGAPTIENE